MTDKTLKLKFRFLKLLIILWIVTMLYVMSPMLLSTTLLVTLSANVVEVVTVGNDRKPVSIGNSYIHINCLECLNGTAYGSLTAVAVVSSGSESLSSQNVDGIIRNGLSLVYNLRNSLRDGNVDALDNGTVNATWELFYDQWRLAYLNGVSGLADSALDWETTAGTAQSEDQIKLLGFTFGLLARKEFFVKRTDKPSNNATQQQTAAYERFLRIVCLDYFEEAIYVYPLALLQEKGLVNLGVKVNSSVVGNEVVEKLSNDDFQAEATLSALVQSISSRVLGSDTTVVKFDYSDLIRGTDGSVNMGNLYPRFQVKYRVPSRSLIFAQRVFGLGKVEVPFGKTTKIINFGNFLTLGTESALSGNRKVGYMLDRAVKYLNTFNPVNNGPAEWRDQFFKREAHWEYEKAIGALAKKDFYISVSAMSVKGFCDNTIYNSADELFGKRNGAATITSGVITVANQYIRQDTCYQISLTQTATPDTTSAFHVAPASRRGFDDLLDLLLLELFFLPGEAHDNTIEYASVKAYSVVSEGTLVNVISPAADVTNEADQIAKMWFVTDSGTISTYTLEGLLSEYRIIDVTAPGLTTAGGYKISVSTEDLPDLHESIQFRDIYHPDNRSLYIMRFGGVSNKPAESPSPDSNDNDNDNDGDDSSDTT